MHNGAHREEVCRGALAEAITTEGPEALAAGADTEEDTEAKPSGRHPTLIGRAIAL